MSCRVLVRNMSAVVLFVLVALIPLQLPGADAGHSGVGVSPATLGFRDPPLLPDSSKIALLRFQQHFDVPVKAEIDVLPHEGQTDDASAWVTVDRAGMRVLDPGEHLVTVQVDVPPAAANGMYKAHVRFKVHPPDDYDFEGSGALAQTSVTAVVVIQVDDENEVKRVAVPEPPTLLPVESGGALRFALTLSNTGNVIANPHVALTIHDQMQTHVLQTFWFNETHLAPGVIQDLELQVDDHGLPAGQYWAESKVYVDDAEVFATKPQTFDVLEAGTLARSLDLKRIAIEDDAIRIVVGSLVKLTAHVENTGQVATIGEFVGEVRRDGAILDSLGSRPLEVPVGGDGELHMLYEPTEPGQYTFIGRVHYGNKVTEEKTVLLEVEDAPAGMVWAFVGAGVLVVGAAGVVAVQRLRR